MVFPLMFLQWFSGVGKCPNWTSPKYCRYNLQIFEGDVQNLQKGTFTNPWFSWIFFGPNSYGPYGRYGDRTKWVDFSQPIGSD